MFTIGDILQFTVSIKRLTSWWRSLRKGLAQIWFKCPTYFSRLLFFRCSLFLSLFFFVFLLPSALHLTSFFLPRTPMLVEILLLLLLAFLEHISLFLLLLLCAPIDWSCWNIKTVFEPLRNRFSRVILVVMLMKVFLDFSFVARLAALMHVLFDVRHSSRMVSRRALAFHAAKEEVQRTLNATIQVN